MVMKKVFASIVAVLALSSTAFAGGNFKFEVKAPSSAKKGEKTTVPVHMAGTAPYHFNMDYPVSIKVTAPSGVKLEKDSMKQGDAKILKKEGAEFELAFTASETGKKTFTGEAKFAVCTPSDCAPQSQKIDFTVEVK
jgi:hypothetical protein